MDYELVDYELGCPTTSAVREPATWPSQETWRVRAKPWPSLPPLERFGAARGRLSTGRHRFYEYQREFPTGMCLYNVPQSPLSPGVCFENMRRVVCFTPLF